VLAELDKSFLRTKCLEKNPAHLRVLQDNSLQVSDGKEPQRFKFDQVFGPDATQQKVFEEIKQLIQNRQSTVTMFAFLPTGQQVLAKLSLWKVSFAFIKKKKKTYVVIFSYYNRRNCWI
jgi:hypothetical protein